jgi:hypothetical protein
MRFFWVATSAVIIGLLAGCGESVYDKPPNLTTSAVVEKIEKTTRYNKAFGSASTTYFLYLTDGAPELKYLHIGRKIDEDDLARSIGQRVTIMCYRADVQSDCHATNYQFQGRELIQPSG